MTIINIIRITGIIIVFQFYIFVSHNTIMTNPEQLAQMEQGMIMVTSPQNDKNLNKFNQYIESNKQKLIDSNFFVSSMPSKSSFKMQVNFGSQSLKSFNSFDDSTMDEIYKLVSSAKNELDNGQNGGMYDKYEYKYLKYKAKYWDAIKRR